MNSIQISKYICHNNVDRYELSSGIIISKGCKMIDEIENRIASSEYDFLRTNEHLGKNIILLGLGGSYAYGLNTPESDLDVRGVALNGKADILGLNKGFEQVIDSNTDTTVYSFNKIVKLLTDCNPNCIEICGLNPEHYIYLSTIGKELINNADMFLSKKAAYTFGGYAASQLRRLDNKSARNLSQTEKEKHIIKSINNATIDFKEKFFEYPDDAIKLYVDDTANPDYDSEIFMDVRLTHYPLRDYKSMWSTMHNIVKDYAKLEQTGRNRVAIKANKLAKHMCHLVRLYLMCFDILEREEIVTYRENEHDFLMSIRNGNYLDDNGRPTPEFFEIVDELEMRMQYAKDNTSLPEKPDYKRINEFVMGVNEMIVKKEV